MSAALPTSLPAAAPAPIAPRLAAHLPGIDVTRAIAAGAVLMAHLVELCTVASHEWREAAPAKLTAALAQVKWTLGAWGVGLFFVLSGLCIHLPMARRLASEPDPRLELGAYFRRRFTRIYPPHLIALGLSVLVALLAPLDRLGDSSLLSVPTWRQLCAHLLMVHTFSVSAFYSVSAVLWTIATETHFYLLYPLLLLLRRRYAMSTIVIVLVGISVLGRAAAHALPPEARTLVAQSALCRFWEWALGCWVAERLVAGLGAKGAPRWMSLLLLAGTFLAGLGLSRLPGGLLGFLWPPLFALALLPMTHLATFEGRALDRAAITLGRESYSMYLSHPIALVATIYLLRRLGAPTWAEAPMALAAALAFTRVYYRAFELPFFLKAKSLDKKRSSQPAA